MRQSRIARERLYELVWEQSMQQLAQEVGVSDVGIAKACKKHGIPIPPRGYWAKLQAGKSVYRPPLPARELGESNYLEISGNLAAVVKRRFGDEEEHQDGPWEDIAAMTEQFKKRIGKLTVPRDFSKAHREIAKLLEKDEMHRQKQLTERYYWHKPQFDTPFEKRRLRMLNAIFIATARAGGRCTVRGSEARDLYISIGDTSLGFTLDRPSKTDRYGRAQFEDSDKLCLMLTAYQPPEGMTTRWQDEEGSKLEQRFPEVFIEIAVGAELLHRAQVRRMVKWDREQKARAIEAERKRIEDERRQEQERLAALAKARLDSLHDDAAALHRADDIRAYVRLINERLGQSVSPGRLREWTVWALKEADQIDPVVSGHAIETLAQFPLENAPEEEGEEASEETGKSG